MVTASLPSPEIESLLLAVNAEFNSAKLPVRVLMLVAMMVDVVLPSRVLSAAAATVLSLRVMERAWPVSFSPARLAMSPSESVAVTAPDVAAERVLACDTLMGPVTEIDSLPRPAIDPLSLAVWAALSSANVPVRVVKPTPLSSTLSSAQ